MGFYANLSNPFDLSYNNIKTPQPELNLPPVIAIMSKNAYHNQGKNEDDQSFAYFRVCKMLLLSIIFSLTQTYFVFVKPAEWF